MVARKRRGFSVVEVMTASLVLGIGALAAVNVYTTAAIGRRMSRTKVMAMKLVDQRLDMLDALGAEQLPSCPSSPKSCRAGPKELTAEKGADGDFLCSQVIYETKLVDQNTNDEGGGVRIDTAVWSHPDTDQRTESVMVMVSACWFTNSGRVLEFSSQRLVLDRGQ